MRKLSVVLVLALLVSVLGVSTVAQAAPDSEACWGQATQAFAQMGEMGEHASQQPTPRLGLANLARALYDDGVIADDSLQALGAFLVEIDPDLTVDACMS